LVTRETARGGRAVSASAWLLMSLVLFAGPGCRTAEEKHLEASLELASQALEVIESNAANPNEGLAALAKLEEDSRGQRSATRAEFVAALEKLDEPQRKAFNDEAKTRSDPLRAKLDAATKRYPEDRRPRIRQLLNQLLR
jgi:hypothetical protein